MKIGIDTNILVYYLDVKSPFHKDIKRKLDKLIMENRAVVTPQNFIELSSVLTKKEVTPEIIEEIVQTISRLFVIVCPDENTLTKFFELLKTYPRRGVKVFDLFLVATFLSHHIHTIYSYNTKDFQDIKEINLY